LVTQNKGYNRPDEDGEEEYVQNYADAKGDVVQGILERAGADSSGERRAIT
jgi:hypothetical protein